jgi:hypothetical protein
VFSEPKYPVCVTEQFADVYFLKRRAPKLNYFFSLAEDMKEMKVTWGLNGRTKEAGLMKMSD